MKIFGIFDKKIQYKVNVDYNQCYGKFYFKEKLYNGILGNNISSPTGYYFCLNGEICNDVGNILIVKKCKKLNI